MRDCILSNMLMDWEVLKIIIRGITGENFAIKSVRQKFDIGGREPGHKTIIFDILVTTESGALINIEIQFQHNTKSYGLRIIQHKARLLNEQLLSGEDFEDCKARKVRVIFINFLSSSKNIIDEFEDHIAKDDVGYSKAFSFNIMRFNKAKTNELKLISAFLNLAASEDDLQKFCIDHSLDLNHPIMSTLMTRYKNVVVSPEFLKEVNVMSVKDIELFEDLSANDDTFSYFSNYFKKKAELAIQEKQEAEKAKQEAEKAKQEAEEKISTVIVNLFKSGMGIDMIANNFLMSPEEVQLVIDNAKNS
jgi:hypothetical protein